MFCCESNFIGLRTVLSSPVMLSSGSEKGNPNTFFKIMMISLSKYKMALVFFVVIGMVYMTLFLPRGNGMDSEASQVGIHVFGNNQRLLQYCNRNISGGVEGRKFPGDSDWELKYVALAVRHGDRSAIHKIPNSVESRHDGAIHLDPAVVNYSPKLSSFALNLKVDGTVSDHKNEADIEDIQSALNPSVAFHTPDLQLSQGQLTSIGFMQHINLGNALHSVYRELVDKVKHKDQIYVRATKYVRTIQSVAGLMTSLLPGVGSANDKVNILVYDNEENEIMHGIGIRTSSKSVNHTAAQGESEYVGGCSASVTLAKRQKESFVPFAAITNRMIEMFGSNVTKLKTEEQADASVPKFCHHEPLPCAASGVSASKCLHSDLVESMMRQTDRMYCDKYTGSHGGSNATKLAIYPFMSEILSHLTTAVTQPDSDPHKRLFSFFSGHDTVIAPVLAALGVYKNNLCQWPPYASRISFELWQHKDNTSSSEPHVRVVYNGLDVTRMIPACQEEDIPALTVTKKAAAINQIVSLCSLKALQRQIDRLIAPYSSIQQACEIKTHY